jgi:hypothetical protein
MAIASAEITSSITPAVRGLHWQAGRRSREAHSGPAVAAPEECGPVAGERVDLVALVDEGVGAVGDLTDDLADPQQLVVVERSGRSY